MFGEDALYVSTLINDYLGPNMVCFENIPLLLEENVYSAIDSCYYCLVATLCPTLLQPHGL